MNNQHQKDQLDYYDHQTADYEKSGILHRGLSRAYARKASIIHKEQKSIGANHDDLPSLPYLTFLDQLFACSYMIAMGLFALFTWGTNVYTKAPDDQKEAAMARIDLVDFIFQGVSLAGFSAVVLLTWTSSY